MYEIPLDQVIPEEERAHDSIHFLLKRIEQRPVILSIVKRNILGQQIARFKPFRAPSETWDRIQCAVNSATPSRF